MKASHSGVEAPNPRDQGTGLPIQTLNEGTESPDLDQKQVDYVDLEKNESTDDVEVNVESTEDLGGELTPNEAFTWNVDGGQSPCGYLSLCVVQLSAYLFLVPEVAACVPNTDDPSIPCNSE